MSIICHQIDSGERPDNLGVMCGYACSFSSLFAILESSDEKKGIAYNMDQRLDFLTDTDYLPADSTIFANIKRHGMDRVGIWRWAHETPPGCYLNYCIDHDRLAGLQGGQLE
jgi:hypothetical protein